MRKPVSILLVVLVLLHTTGYYAVFMRLEHNNDVSMDQKLDADNYDPSQTITIKLPLTVPYMGGNGDFERVEGKFQHKGEFYRLVKQKYANDTLTVICVKDQETKKIHNALADFVKSFTDTPGDQQHNGKLTTVFIKEYIQNTFSLIPLSTGWQAEVGQNISGFGHTSSFSTRITHPPEHA